MAKADIVAAALASIQSGQAQVLSDAIGVACDASANDQKASDGSFTQADIDAAVSSAQSVDAAALASAKAASDAALADLQSKLDALAAKEGQEASVIAGLQSSMQQAKDAVAAVIALLPAPAAPVA